MESVPVSVDLSEAWAADSVPVLLCVLWAGNGEVLSLSADRPSSLGEPQLFSSNSSSGLAECRLVESGTAINRVGESVLKVWECVDTDPVDGVNDSLVRTVDPRGPSIDVTNWSTCKWCTTDGLSELCDVFGKGGWVSTVARLGCDTCWADSVKILTSDRDTNDQICEGRSVL